MNNTNKLYVVGLLALLATVFASTSVAADPYDGVNRIGAYYQYTNQYYYNYESNFQYYDYAAPARAGGWYGQGTEWLVGLRSPVWAPVPPVHYSNQYQQVCGLGCWFGGGNGYPQYRASDFPQYRSRPGGVFSY
ncbi:TPA: hypothetical protein HA251_07010 [Candidatus Woesearchaeota archaeon]|nr:hypothetical protein [Candidatus Woesearchaeota archaeon]